MDRRLTDDEYNALNQIASKTKMDCWFYILEEDEHDVILDLENNKVMPITLFFAFLQTMRKT